MKISLRVGDRVFYRGGKTIWTIEKIENPSWQTERYFELVNENGRHATAFSASDVRLILEIDKAENFDVVVMEKQYA